jgi:hypothetical protein
MWRILILLKRIKGIVMCNTSRKVFKKGDRVKCILGNAAGNPLTEGNVYEVLGTDSDDWPVVVNDDGYTSHYMDSRFELLPSVSYPNPPHVHAELIKAWADGAAIQFLATSSGSEGWTDVGKHNPVWKGGRLYRIKPSKTNRDYKIEELKLQAEALAVEIGELRGDI